MKINFSEPKLVDKYGSWVRVQVAFYDFIFQSGTDLCGTHFNQVVSSEIIEAAASGERAWGDGAPLYERTVKNIERAFATPEDAWQAFCIAEHVSGYGR